MLFQFQQGTIWTEETPQTTERRGGFQFQQGTIWTDVQPSDISADALFQFQQGTIWTVGECGQDIVDGSFNSSKVQFERDLSV